MVIGLSGVQFVWVIIRFRVQFGINFLKNSQVQINFKLNEKNRMITY